MPATRTIEIDLDVHKAIEKARTSLEETENAILRRLLHLTTKTPPLPSGKSPKAPEGRPWAGKGVTLPHGTELRMNYRGQVLKGRIDNGIWSVEGKRANSPSDAASQVATTKSGGRPQLNGWIYWEVKRPGDQAWKKLQTLGPKK